MQDSILNTSWIAAQLCCATLVQICRIATPLLSRMCCSLDSSTHAQEKSCELPTEHACMLQGGFEFYIEAEFSSECMSLLNIGTECLRQKMVCWLQGQRPLITVYHLHSTMQIFLYFLGNVNIAQYVQLPSAVGGIWKSVFLVLPNTVQVCIGSRFLDMIKDKGCGRQRQAFSEREQIAHLVSILG